MGGEQALAALGAGQRIRAVVAEGATGQQQADHGWKPNGITGVLERGVEWGQYTTAGLLSGAPRPVLIIAAEAVSGEPVAARWFHAASPATVQVWVVPHAGHTQGLATAPLAWENRRPAVNCGRAAVRSRCQEARPRRLPRSRLRACCR